MRTTNAILSTLLGLLLLIVGIGVVVEMAVIALGWQQAPLASWYATLRDATFADSRFLTTALVAALVGLALIILELRPRAPQRVQTNAAAGPPLSIPRRSVEHRVDSAAAEAGVARAHSMVRGRPDRWRLRLYGVAEPDQRDAVMTAVQAELERLDAPPDVAVSLALRRPAR
jgi:hypothetical protein